MVAPAPGGVEPGPGLATVETFTAAGLKGWLEAQGDAGVPALWSRLIGQLPVPGQQARWTTVGVVWREGDGPPAYLAGVPLEAGAAPPPGLDAVTVPAGRYKVFRVTLAGGPVSPQMQAAMRLIRETLFPATGLPAAAGPVFERYEGSTAPTEAGAVVDVHIPVAP